jgi:hypothetical protein
LRVLTRPVYVRRKLNIEAGRTAKADLPHPTPAKLG